MMKDNAGFFSALRGRGLRLHPIPPLSFTPPAPLHFPASEQPVDIFVLKYYKKVSDHGAVKVRAIN
jgi:hypothetical protein